MIRHKILILEHEEDCYLFYFETERKYSIAQRKSIACEDSGLTVGARLKVKDGTKLYIGRLMNISKYKRLKKVA
jgi:hypothetical protein